MTQENGNGCPNFIKCGLILSGKEEALKVRIGDAAVYDHGFEMVDRWRFPVL